jgi:ethanolamine permease
MALGRAGYAPRVLGQVHPHLHTPVLALVVNAIVGVLAILSGRTGDIITLACFGAVSLYVVAMLSLFALRRREPELPRPFRALLYPLAPALALVLSAGALVALVAYNLAIAGVFAALVAGALGTHALTGRGSVSTRPR